MQFNEVEIIEATEKYRAHTQKVITGCWIDDEVLTRHMKADWNSVVQINDPDAQEYAQLLAACIAHLTNEDHMTLTPTTV